MTIEEAKQNIGKLVMSQDAGYKLIPRVHTPHGPYKLLKITKGGLAILENHHGNQVKPSLLTLC